MVFDHKSNEWTTVDAVLSAQPEPQTVAAPPPPQATVAMQTPVSVPPPLKEKKISTGMGCLIIVLATVAIVVFISMTSNFWTKRMTVPEKATPTPEQVHASASVLPPIEQWLVICGVVDSEATGKALINKLSTTVGDDAKIMSSNDYEGLSPNLQIAVAGMFTEHGDAASRVELLKATGAECYQKQVKTTAVISSTVAKPESDSHFDGITDSFISKLECQKSPVWNSAYRVSSKNPNLWVIDCYFGPIWSSDPQTGGERSAREAQSIASRFINAVASLKGNAQTPKKLVVKFFAEAAPDKYGNPKAPIEIAVFETPVQKTISELAKYKTKEALHGKPFTFIKDVGGKYDSKELNYLVIMDATAATEGLW